MKPPYLIEHGDIEASVQYISGFVLPDSAAVLDVGTHSGYFLSGIGELGYQNVRGIDIDALRFAKVPNYN
jgi:ribosomal protein L11 methylase PrmA